MIGVGNLWYNWAKFFIERNKVQFPLQVSLFWILFIVGFVLGGYVVYIYIYIYFFLSS